jgi:hypothetical protein
MKTKTLLYILMSVLVLSFASCTDDDKIDYLTKDEIPESIQTFASKYLSNNKLLSVYIDKDYSGGYYFAQFEGGVKAQFTSEGEWFILESEKGLPETTRALLSDNSRKELSEQIAGAKVLMLTNPATGDIGIYLDNYEIYYDLTGHEGKTLAEELHDVGLEKMPENMKLFVSKYFGIPTREMKPWYSVLKFSGFKGTIYRFRTSPYTYTYVDFYEDGEWFYMKESEKENTVKDKYIKAIPAEVLATLKKEAPNAIASIKKITRFDDNKIYGFNKLYGFDFGDDQFILINSENQIVEPPIEKAKEFIKKCFSLEDGLQYKVNPNTTTAYFLRYAFIVTSPTKEIFLATDVYGNMRRVSTGPITTDETKTIALPRAVIEMLHEDIVTYFDTNFPEGKAIRISYGYSKVGDMPNKVSLMMSIPNNLHTLVFDCNTGEFIEEYYTLSIAN